MNRLRLYSLLSPTWFVLGLALIVPMLLMFIISFAERGTYGGIRPIGDLSQYIFSGNFLQNYIRTMDPLYLGICWRSLWMAIATTGACLILSYPIAYYIAIVAAKEYRKLLLVLVVIPFWTCFLIRTYAWMFILRSEGFINLLLTKIGLIQTPLPLLYNDYSVLLGLVYAELPFMILPLYASLEKFDLTLLEAAEDLGAKPFQSFWRITVPMSMPGIMAGIILVFIPSVGQFIVSDLLGGAKSILAGNLIQNQFAVARNKPFGAAISFELMSFVLIVLLSYSLFSKNRKQKESIL